MSKIDFTKPIETVCGVPMTVKNAAYTKDTVLVVSGGPLQAPRGAPHPRGAQFLYRTDGRHAFGKMPTLRNVAEKFDPTKPAFLSDGTPVSLSSAGGNLYGNLPVGTSVRLGISGTDTGRCWNKNGSHYYGEAKLKLTNVAPAPMPSPAPAPAEPPLDTSKPLQTRDGKPVRFVGKIGDTGQLVVEVTYASGWTSEKATELRYHDGRKSANRRIQSGDDIINKVVVTETFRNVYADASISDYAHKSLDAATRLCKLGKTRVGILQFTKTNGEVTSSKYHPGTPFVRKRASEVGVL